METYTWTKFYPDHCDDRVVSLMISENVRILWDEVPDAADFADALITLQDFGCREWLYHEFVEANAALREEYILEYLNYEGIDDLFWAMINDSDLELSHDFLIEILDFGVHADELPRVLGRYNGLFSGEEAEELFSSYDVPEEYASVILSERIEGVLSYDQIEEIMNCIDAKLYPVMMPHIRKLSFENRVEIMDEFGIDVAATRPESGNKNEPGRFFSGAAMAASVIEGIRQGIHGNSDDNKL